MQLFFLMDGKTFLIFLRMEVFETENKEKDLQLL